MSEKKTPEAVESRQGSQTMAGRIADVVMLVWMLGVTCLWWLLYGPGMTFITERLGILAGLHDLRTALLQFFTFTTWGVR